MGARPGAAGVLCAMAGSSGPVVAPVSGAPSCALGAHPCPLARSRGGGGHVRRDLVHIRMRRGGGLDDDVGRSSPLTLTEESAGVGR
jgi:hypothetical protein